MIQPIPTTYNGIKYRSRTEARWAIFFEIGDIPVRYEAEGYKTSAGWYLPDFQLAVPEPPVFFEVKPGTPNEEEISKLAALAGGIDKAEVFVALGPPGQDYVLWNIRPDASYEQWFFAKDHAGHISYLANCVQGCEGFYIQIRKDPAPVCPNSFSDIAEHLEAAARHQFEDKRPGNFTSRRAASDWREAIRDCERRVISPREQRERSERRVVLGPPRERRVVRRP